MIDQQNQPQQPAERTCHTCASELEPDPRCPRGTLGLRVTVPMSAYPNCPNWEPRQQLAKLKPHYEPVPGMDEPCDSTEKHCACVSLLRQQVSALEHDLNMAKEYLGHWRSAANTSIGKCQTCDGDGVMSVVVGVEAPTGIEQEEIEPCGECLGTGRGDLTRQLELLRMQDKEYISELKFSILVSEQAATRSATALGATIDAAVEAERQRCLRIIIAVVPDYYLTNRDEAIRRIESGEEMQP